MDDHFISDEQDISELNELANRALGKYLGPNEINLLLKYSQPVLFNSGEVLLQQGVRIDGIYLILQGTVLVNAIIMGQGTKRLESLFPGQFVGAISFMEKGPCFTSFLATDNVLCLLIPNSYFQRLAYDSPDTKYKLFQELARQICLRLKTSHDIVTSFISESKMTSLSFFDRVIHSLNQPSKMVFEDSGVNKDYLYNNPLFKAFTTEELEELFHHFVMLDASKNCKLISEGEKNASCYLVLYGAIQSCIIQDGKLAKLSVIGPGTLLASIGCIDRSSSFNITYITCEQTMLFKLPVAALQLIKEEKPELWYKLYELICGSVTALKKSIDKLNIRLHTELYNR
ncbi:Crp/Fnr family transcriptional regulator [uncultured Legionella sp.]|uniref:Crp/Fnr family transcriptional regulator n=1 Tax=uncultured Legionella sp. TaxID=210934 RepID=UPI00262DAF8D|nr:cyclic nucleotide-binding domain-containing protein [uncultured Legionella sp.]